MNERFVRVGAAIKRSRDSWNKRGHAVRKRSGMNTRTKKVKEGKEGFSSLLSVAFVVGVPLDSRALRRPRT